VQIVRVIVGVVTGIVSAFVIIGCVDLAGWMALMPKGVDWTNHDAVRRALHAMPQPALWIEVVGWTLGALVGTLLAAKISRMAAQGAIVGALLLTSAIMQMLHHDHPLTLIIVGSGLLILAATLGTMLGAPRGGAPPAAAAAAGLGAVLVVLCCASAPARAGDPPGDWWRAKMNQDFTTQSSVRITGSFGRAELSGMHAEPTGLRVTDIRPVRGAGTPSFAENDPTLISWSSIDRVETQTSAAGRGALLGGLIGTGAALAVSLARNDLSSTQTDLRPLILIGAGAGLGAILGGGMHRWETYYPPVDRGIRVHPVASGR
jgi:hypothetical protein